MPFYAVSFVIHAVAILADSISVTRDLLICCVLRAELCKKTCFTVEELTLLPPFVALSEHVPCMIDKNVKRVAHSRGNVRDLSKFGSTVSKEI